MSISKYLTVNSRLVAATLSGNTTSYMSDDLGSVVATINYSGAKVNDYRYKPYGSTLRRPAAAQIRDTNLWAVWVIA